MKIQLTIMGMFAVLVLNSAMGELAPVFIKIIRHFETQTSAPEHYLEELRNYARQKTISSQDFAMSKIWEACILSGLDREPSILESIQICDDIISAMPDTWQADIMSMIRIVNYGLIGKRHEQIALILEALKTIDFERLDAEENQFLNLCRTRAGVLSRTMKDQLYAMLGYAYRNEFDFEKAEGAYVNISIPEIREKELHQLQRAKESRQKFLDSRKAK